MKRNNIIKGALIGAIAAMIGCKIGLNTSASNKSFPLRSGVPGDDPDTPLGCDQIHHTAPDRRVSVLITGAGSYIGESFKAYVAEHYPESISIDTIDMIDPSWRKHPFTVADGRPYDTVFHVAGIAHADVGRATDAGRENYYRVNTDLAVETARKAKDSGCRQFIFMSSMIVYGDQEHVTRGTVPCPSNFYGDSKWQADKGVRAMASDGFAVAVLRSPMIYGRGSKGNYRILDKLARRIPFYPGTDNTRSMLYIDNLCEFLSQLMLAGSGGIYFPQNPVYSNTGLLMKLIANSYGKQMYPSGILDLGVIIAKHVPISCIRELACKAFGSSYYDMDLSEYRGLEYQKVDLETSIIRSRG